MGDPRQEPAPTNAVSGPQPVTVTSPSRAPMVWVVIGGALAVFGWVMPALIWAWSSSGIGGGSGLGISALPVLLIAIGIGIVGTLVAIIAGIIWALQARRRRTRV